MSIIISQGEVLHNGKVVGKVWRDYKGNLVAQVEVPGRVVYVTRKNRDDLRKALKAVLW